MNYIVFDLEWNQGNEHRERQRKDIPFEIIEVGAVKLNNRMEIVDTFHELVKPQIYHEMHYMTRKLLNLTMDDLRSGRKFSAVLKDFLEWCALAENGEQVEYRFATWGPQDLTELQRNMNHYRIQPLSDRPLPYYDVQKLFAIAYEDKKTRRNLEYATDYLQIEKGNDFHQALSDAWYTAKVLEQIRDPEVLKLHSYDTFHLPATHKDEVFVVFGDYAKYISRRFEDKQELLADHEVLSTRCYLCHRNLKRRMRWFSPNGKHYYSVSQCEMHGPMKGKIRVKKTLDDSGVYAVKTLKLVSEEEALELLAKKDKVHENRKARVQKENQRKKTAGIPPKQ